MRTASPSSATRSFAYLGRGCTWWIAHFRGFCTACEDDKSASQLHVVADLDKLLRFGDPSPVTVENLLRRNIGNPGTSPSRSLSIRLRGHSYEIDELALGYGVTYNMLKTVVLGLTEMP